jgi:hypothetical protein
MAKTQVSFTNEAPHQDLKCSGGIQKDRNFFPTSPVKVILLLKNAKRY